MIELFERGNVLKLEMYLIKAIDIDSHCESYSRVNSVPSTQKQY